MRFPLFTAAFAALALALPTTAQKVQVYGGNTMRACSSVLLFGDDIMAGITVTHGQPEWKSEYADVDAMVTKLKLKGTIARLGKDLWTTLMTNVPLEIGGAKVPAGSYVCGLKVGMNGDYALALLDATKAMKAGAMPFGPQNWTPDVLCPLTLEKDVTDERVTKMLITLAADKANPMKGTFTIAWGPHALVAPMAVATGTSAEAKNADAKK